MVPSLRVKGKKKRGQSAADVRGRSRKRLFYFVSKNWGEKKKKELGLLPNGKKKKELKKGKKKKRLPTLEGKKKRAPQSPKRKRKKRCLCAKKGSTFF